MTRSRSRSQTVAWVRTSVRSMWRLDGLYPVVFLLVYSLCVTVMILQLTREQSRAAGGDPFLTLRQVRVPGPYDDCILINMSAEEMHERSQHQRLRTLSAFCDLCKLTTNTSKAELNLSYCPEGVGVHKAFSQDYARKLSFKNILVDDENGLLFCLIPKVASSNWKRALLKLRNNSTIAKDFNIHSRQQVRDAGFTFLDLYSFSERRRRIKNYHKVIFVRHPLARLLSAYRDKFTKNITWSIFFQRKYGRAIVDRFRPNASDDERMNGRDITFMEFAKYIIEGYRAGRYLNVHWTPMHQICRPCEIKYDFVGKFESLNWDAQKVIGRLFGAGRACASGFPAENISPVVNMKSIMQTYHALGQDVFSELYEMFQPDFDLFGYDVQRIVRTGEFVV